MEEIRGEYADIKLTDGIVHVIYKCESYDEKMVDQSIRDRFLVTKNESYPMFSDARKIKKFSREARHRLSQKDAGDGVIAVSILTNSKIQQVIYNFFNVVFKAPSPTRLFSDQEKAMEWLQQFK